MAPRVVFALLLCVGVASASSGRISGGSETTIEAYPMAAQVEKLDGTAWSQAAAGTILTSRYILSSGQIGNGERRLFSVEYLRVRVGSGTRNYGGEVYNVEAVRIHPDFNAETRLCDISLVRLSEPVSYTLKIQPGTIISGGYTLPDNLQVSLVGWGDVTDDEPAEELQRANAVTINLDECSSRLEELDAPELTENNICVGGAEEEANAGACAGDVGGPIIYTQEPYPLVVGIISWRKGCENSTLPTVATGVSQFTDWILENAV